MAPLTSASPPGSVHVRPHQHALSLPGRPPTQGAGLHAMLPTPGRTAPVPFLRQRDPGQSLGAISHPPRQSQTGSRAWPQSAVVRLSHSVPPGLGPLAVVWALYATLVVLLPRVLPLTVSSS